jgi:hypothetical protein
VILAPPGREDFDVLSGSGAVIWELVDEPCTMAELLGSLAQMYGTADQDIRGDVDVLVKSLLHIGAIEEIHDGDGSVR